MGGCVDSYKESAREWFSALTIFFRQVGVAQRVLMRLENLRLKALKWWKPLEYWFPAICCFLISRVDLNWLKEVQN
jgi:hypothetical protein